MRSKYVEAEYKTKATKAEWDRLTKVEGNLSHFKAFFQNDMTVTADDLQLIEDLSNAIQLEVASLFEDKLTTLEVAQ